MFSIIILTYNEEHSLKACLESVKWCDDIVVVDSFSSDNTCFIAKGFGTRVVKNEFIDFASQRNFALENLNFKYDWVFHLDADEHFTKKLKKECEEAIIDYDFGAFLVPSRTILFGKWIKHASSYPVYQMRFHRLGDARFVQHGHGQRETDLKNGMGYLTNPYNHFAFSTGLTKWLKKHAQYAEDEAKTFLEAETNDLRLNLISRDKTKRRRALKTLSYRLPFRPFLRFLHLYFIQRGFLDGKEGFLYCKMMGVFQAMIDIKLHELKSK